MIFYIKNADKTVAKIKNPISYELSSACDTPCDSLRLFFLIDEIEEAISVQAYDDDKLIFNGIVDRQTYFDDENGKKCFIFARSTASILVDNEATPASYQSPSLSGLFFMNLRGFNIKNELPEMYCKEKYIVPKGTSCFSVIQNFVSIFGDNTIFINPQNEMQVYRKSKDIKQIDKNIISKKFTINRGNPVSEICYQVDSKSGYTHHLKSNFFEGSNISKKRYLNLSNVPNWMRKTKAKEKISSLASDYLVIEIATQSVSALALYDRVKTNEKYFGKFDMFLVKEKTVIKNSDGEKTLLKLVADIDFQEENYVAE